MFRGIVGAAMRLYRVSPLYPHLGRSLGKVLGAVTRNKIVLHEIDGVTFELDLAEVIDSSLYYSGTFEADAERTITKALRPGMTAIDIGANVGYHTFRMGAAVGPSGKVIAIEPTAWALGKLRRDSALNPRFNNIEVIHAALGDQDRGPTKLRLKSSYRLDGTDTSADEIVSLCTMDTLFASLARIDFIKMDVDGLEGQIFRGARETLKAYRPTLFFEISPDAMRVNGDSPDEMIAFLKSLEYTFKTEGGEPVSDLSSLLSTAYSVNLYASARDHGQM